MESWTKERLHTLVIERLGNAKLIAVSKCIA